MPTDPIAICDADASDYATPVIVHYWTPDGRQRAIACGKCELVEQVTYTEPPYPDGTWQYRHWWEEERCGH